MILTLAENKILCLDDLAELDSEELLELLGEHDIEDEAAGDIIMAARAHWFADEDAEAEETAAADSGRCAVMRPLEQAGSNNEANSAIYGNLTGGRAVSLRRCLATGQSAEKDRLIRFVASPEGELVADIYGRLGGRGAWVSADKQHLKPPVQNLFARFLRQSVTIKEGFISHLGDQLAHILINRMSMMRKSGALVTGRGKLEMAASRLDGLLIADVASQREAASLIHMVQPDWYETGLPAGLLGQIAGVDSLAYAGVLHAAYPSEQKQIDALLVDLQRWRAVTQTQKTIE